ncbi:hypothetical protein F511_21704 [Dorcoceras hygrometricum]|uniref:Uncharacterized protein n=1 Tax=Dorcoceras hygrometricum TaxID=472368 RepID=A0A2Z7AAY5_9LAMI|nr:hypothetical protein F511_21704 [Dorcoceras hygrometricum]
MKRGLRWSDGEDDDTESSDESSAVGTDPDGSSKSNLTEKNQSFKLKASKDASWRKIERKHDLEEKLEVRHGLADMQSCFLVAVDSAKKKSKGIDFEALSRHGYKGGLSVLKVPPPKEPEPEQDWTWSTGKETRPKEEEESFEERQKTRASIASGEELVYVQARKDKKNLSFQQKEKRKRDLGQASRGKNYVEEEKRMLRESGIYSGFDS